MQPTALRIRDEIPADHAAIEAVTEAAFRNAPHAGHAEHFIVNALRAANKLSLSLVAERDGEIVGHVAVSPVSISDGTPEWFGLGPISVVPRYQGLGIGSALMNEALQRLRESGAAGCVLVGNPAYYQRFGFRAEPGLVYPGLPPEYFQAISFTATLPRGTVSYHEAFDARA